RPSFSPPSASAWRPPAPSALPPEPAALRPPLTSTMNQRIRLRPIGAQRFGQEPADAPPVLEVGVAVAGDQMRFLSPRLPLKKQQVQNRRRQHQRRRDGRQRGDHQK